MIEATTELVELADIEAAARAIAPVAVRTPLLPADAVAERVGAPVWIKPEMLQRGGAFKFRGAFNFLSRLDVAARQRGVIAPSSGNHAQAVALAAASVGAPATIVMPADAPKSKLEATRGYGARVVTYDRMAGNREAIGRQISEQSGATLVPPYDHPWTIAGQGTVALEFLEQAADLDALVIPIGGGGLISGCAIAAKALRPGIRIFGVEPEDGNDTYLSLRAGARVEIPMPSTIADGLRATKPGAITFPIVQEHVEDVVLVNDGEIRETMQFVMTRMKMLVEPSGAATAAAVLHRKLPAGIKRAGVLISGGNVDLEFLRTLAS